MEIIEKQEQDITIFKLSGRLDSKTSLGFEEKIISAIDGGSAKITVDFEGLDYISSAGLRVLNKAAKRLRQNKGKIMLCCLKDYVREVFEIAGFDTFLPIVPTLDEALQGF
jgi:anti-sigma B factor antagonist